MIIDKLENSNLYCNNEKFTIAFDFLKELNTDSEEKRYELDNGIFAVIESYPTKPLSEGRLEAHRKYIDIQICLSGVDNISWKALKDCYQISKEYNEENDILFFKDKLDASCAIGPGRFAIFFPHDAHAPVIADGPLHKIVVKVKA